MLYCIKKTGRHYAQLARRALAKRRRHAFTLLMFFALPVAAITPPGTLISNTASVSNVLIGSETFSINSNTAEVTSTIIGTPASLALYTYVPTGQSSVGLSATTVTQCFDGSSYIPITNPVNRTPGSATPTPYDTTVAEDLEPINDMAAGDALVIRVQDADQNLDASVVEQVEVTIQTADGDQETLQLFEESSNSEYFIGVIQTAIGTVDVNNCVLEVKTTAQQLASSVVVNYVDQYDASDTVNLQTLVDPFGVLFDSTTGVSIDGATVALEQDSGGGVFVPATVFGDDGVATYPNILTSGGTATDSNGTSYNFPSGGYRFPLVAPGVYRLVITPAGNYAFPSQVDIATLQTRPNAPFALQNGSFGQTFTVTAGPPVQIDVPLDPLVSTLLVEKNANANQGAIGDFVHYHVAVENVNPTGDATNVTVRDTLPIGFRYQAGSATVNGVAIADPVIATNGRELQFNIGNIAANGGRSELRYVVAIVAGAPLGKAINNAQAVDSFGNLSNNAQHELFVQDALLRSSGIVIGRVSVGDCPAQSAQTVGQARLEVQGESLTAATQRYAVNVAMQNASISKMRLVIDLPRGESYVAGSASLDDLRIQDPIIQNQQLRFIIGNDQRWPNDWQHAIQFTTLTLDKNNNNSNIRVEALFDNAIQQAQSTGVVTWQTGEAPASQQVPIVALQNTEPPRDQAEAEAGVEGIKIYLDNGTYVTTDKQGYYHFEGLSTQTHVLQIDTATLPENMTLQRCIDNTRLAGAAHSRFVDLQGGSLWRADFYLQASTLKSDTLQMRIQSERVDDNVNISVDKFVGRIPVENFRLTVNLPRGLEYLAGSAQLQGKRLADPEQYDGVLVFRLGDLNKLEAPNIRFNTQIISPNIPPDAKVEALAIFNTIDEKNIRTDTIAAPVMQQVSLAPREAFYILFPSLADDVSQSDQSQLREIVATLNAFDIESIKLVGHTDNIAADNNTIDSEQLSRRRAESVANYLQSALTQQDIAYTVEAQGAQQPIATNNTTEGRRKNRRVAVFVTLAQDAADAQAITSQLSHPVSITTDEQRRALPTLPAAKKLHIEAFNKTWLNQQDATAEWLMPAEDYIPSSASVSIAIKHAADHVIEGTINGETINPLFFFGKLTSSDETIARSYWQGIHLKTGPNTLRFTIRDAAYQIVETLERTVYFSDQPADAVFVEKYSRLTANGVDNPVIAVQFLDQWQQPLRAGVTGRFSLNTPYVSKTYQDAIDANLVTNADQKQPVYKVGAQGIALIELLPTTQTGVVELSFELPNQVTRQVDVWLQPELRDWLLVGVAELGLSKQDLSVNTPDDDPRYTDETVTDGRVSFFAKGQIKGEWLLTAAYDSEKAAPTALQTRLFSVIDPNEYYTLYGDDAQQGYDAASADKLYLKIEKSQFYALYGDFNTGLQDTVLLNYQRAFTGLQSAFENENYVFNLFAAENTSQFIKDEIPGEGISGLYQLSAAANDIVINSERVMIETRDRFNSETVIETVSLRRHLDYSIDYDDGTLFFKEPIANRDFNFNPVFIVVDYEVEAPVAGDISLGGRGAAKLANDRMQIGVTKIVDETFAEAGDLQGVDARYQVSDTSAVTFEYATSDQAQANTAVQREGDAYLLQYEITDQQKQLRAYVRESEPGFGLGQQNGAATGLRKQAIEGTLALTPALRVNAELSNETNTDTEPASERDLMRAELAYAQAGYGWSAGVTQSTDTTAGNQQRSDLLDLGGYKQALQGRLLTRIQTSQPLTNNDNTDFSNRTIVGADYKLSSAVSLFTEHEVTASDASNTDTQTTRLGLRASPWQRAEVRSSVQQAQSENSLRRFANLGLSQDFVINDRWSADVGLERSETLSDSTRNDINNDNTFASGSANSSDFTALSFGSNYRFTHQQIASRIEQRDSDTSDKLAILFSWQRDYINGIGYALRAQQFDTDFAAGSAELQQEWRFSTAYRPITSRWAHLNRLDFTQNRSQSATGEVEVADKVINNWKSNFQYNPRNQWAFSYALKQAETTIEVNTYKSLTHFAAVEYRHDISHKFDIGTQLSILRSAEQGVAENSYGLSLGWSFTRNAWLSVGYNVEGFTDSDFADADYSVQGLYLKLRYKFDQHSFDSNKWF